MKKVLFVFSASLIILISGGCGDKKEKYEVVTSLIQYDVPLKSDDPQLDWWVNNIEGSRREPFIKRIMNAASSGQFRVYDYFNNQLTSEQINAIGSDTVYQTLVREFPPYEEYDTMLVFTTDYRDIMKVRFLEEWTWDPESLDLKKRIIGIAPLASQAMGNQTYNRFLFWIYLDKGYPAPNN